MFSKFLLVQISKIITFVCVCVCLLHHTFGFTLSGMPGLESDYKFRSRGDGMVIKEYQQFPTSQVLQKRPLQIIQAKGD